MNRNLLVSIAIFASLPALAAPREQPRDAVRRLYVSFAEGDVAELKRLLKPGIGTRQMSDVADNARVKCNELVRLVIGEPQINGERTEVPAEAAFVLHDRNGGADRIDVEHSIIALKASGSDWIV